jgi:hypothetical protein
MVRLGTDAGMTAAEVNSLKREIFAAAQGAKISYDELLVPVEKMSDLGYDFITANIGTISDAIQGLGLSGDTIYGLISSFKKYGYTADEVKQKFNELADYTDYFQSQGFEFNEDDFRTALPRIMESGRVFGQTSDDMRDMMASFGALSGGLRRPEQALNSFFDTLLSTETQTKLKNAGVNIWDASGAFKNFSEVMAELTRERGYDVTDVLGESNREVLDAWKAHGARAEAVKNMAVAGDSLHRRAVENAKTLKSALTGLQDAVIAQADGLFSAPIEKLANLLNEHPVGLKTAIQELGLAIGGIAALRAFAGVVNLVTNLKGLKGGGIDLSGMSKAAGGAGMPVYVTNLGAGGLGGGSLPGPSSSLLVDPYGNPLASPKPASPSAAPAGAPGPGPGVLSKLGNAALAYAPVAVAGALIHGGILLHNQTEAEGRENFNARVSEELSALATNPYDAQSVVNDRLARGWTEEEAWNGRKWQPPPVEAPPVMESAGISQTATAGIAAQEPEIKQPRTLVSNDGRTFAEVSAAVREEVRAVSAAPAAAPAVTVDPSGEVKLQIDITQRDERLQAQAAIVKNTTLIPFNPGSSVEARRLN